MDPSDSSPHASLSLVLPRHFFALRPTNLRPEGRILTWYYGFDANISFTFQVVKNLSKD